MSVATIQAIERESRIATQLRGCRVLITGASFGIGAATARVLARKGTKLILWARTRDALDALAREITSAGGEAAVFAVDLAKAGEISTAAKAVLEQFGPPDVIVNNAGSGRWLSVEESTPEDAAAAMAVPYLAAFATTRAFLPTMVARGSGAVVNVTSPAAFMPLPGATTYSVARWAMRGFHEQLTAELVGTGVHTSLIVPGLVESSYFAHNPGSLERLPRVVRWLVPTLTPEQVGWAIARGIERNRRIVVTPAMLRVLMLLHHLAPLPCNWLMRQTGWQRPKNPTH